MYKVLIVEDETNSRDGLCSLLATYQTPLEIRSAANGLDGFRLACSWNPDIVISDIKMPLMDGLTMMKKLHEHHFKGRMILLTGYAEFEYAQSALSYGVSAYILKPIVPEQLYTLIKTSIKEMERLQPPPEIPQSQIRHLITEEDAQLLLQKISKRNYSHYFTAVIYIETERHLPSFVKESLLKERDLNLILLPDSNYRGILIGFADNRIRHQVIARISALLEAYEHLTCTYEIMKSSEIHNCHSFSDQYERLTKAIPWSMSYQSSFLAYEAAMECEDDKDYEDPMLKKKLRKLLNDGDYRSYGLLLLEYLYLLQEQQRHPKVILLAAISNLTKINSEQRYLQVINQMSAAKTIHEVKRILTDYFTNETSPFVNDSYPKLIRQALYEIEHNYGNPITLNSTADKLNITPQYLSRLFAKEMNVSFIDSLTEYRLEKAKYLLTNTNKKINVICRDVGYPDAKYFCTLFRKVVGVSPNQFRNN